MKKVIIIGNPNTGKTTLFNSLTRSNAHTGNWHGVTVDALQKVVKYKSQEYMFIDIPGLYSLNYFSMEEKVSADVIAQNRDAIFLYIVDANCLERNLYLAMQLIEQGVQFNIIINNYKYFKKQGNSIDVQKLSNLLQRKCIVADARKVKLNDDILSVPVINTHTDYVDNLPIEKIETILQKNNINNTKQKAFNILENEIIDEKLPENDINLIKKYFNNYFDYLLKCRYEKINNICQKCLNYRQKRAYGESKLDKYLLNKILFFIIFGAIIFSGMFLIFFLVGPILTDLFLNVINFAVKMPIMAIIEKVTSSEFLINFFDQGVFSAGLAVLGFLPQVCLLFMMLAVLEESGLLSRMAFMLDDLFYPLGLNGKSAYSMLMGFGCSTTATLTAKNMTEKNARVKTAILTPYMSCSAKLPVYSVIAGSIFGAKSFWVILGLYLLGIVVAILLAFVLEKTILPSKNSDFLLEFPPMRAPSIGQFVKVAYTNAKHFFVKVFTIIFGVNIIVWLLSNINFSLTYVGESGDSITYGICRFISPVFAPLGLNNAYIVSALIIGLIAKELILSNISIHNKVDMDFDQIKSSIVAVGSAVVFTKASAVSFLVFCLLYSPCISNIAVLYSEIGKKYATIAVVIQFVLAYVLGALAYALFRHSVGYLFIVIVCVSMILVSLIMLIKRAKNRNFGACNNCNKCKNNNICHK